MKIKRLFSFFCILLAGKALCLDADVDIYRACNAFPSREICKKSLQKINKIKQQLDECCTDLDLKFNVLEQEIQRLQGCGNVTPIATDNYTITESGNYCLTADVSGVLTIAADNVILNLNDHAINGGSTGLLINGQKNVIVQNGRIQNVDSIGLDLHGNCSSIEIKNIIFSDNSGENIINLDEVYGFRIADCTFINNNIPSPFALIYVLNSANGIIRSCSAYSNRFVNGIIVSPGIENLLMHDVHVDNNVNRTTSVMSPFRISGQNINVYKCTSNNNTASNSSLRNFGLYVLYDSSISECITSNNTANSVTGFYVDSTPIRLVVESCLAIGNNGTSADGLVTFNVADSSFINCLCSNNTSNGFLIYQSSEVNTQDCAFYGNVAVNNGTAGFSVTDTLARGNGFFSNYASSNGTNYINVPVANIQTYTANAASLPSNTVAWNNINVIP